MKKQSPRKLLLSLGAALLVGTAAFVIFRRRSDPSGKRLPNQAIYRVYAPIYDRLFGPFYAAARQRAVQLLELLPGEQLLISGVGTGLDLPLIRKGVDVTGVDISADMLRQANLKESQANIHLIQMDAQRLDLPAGSFDAVLLSLIVSVAPDGHAVFQEAWRALKPGGRLVLFDKFVPENSSIGLLRNALGSLIRLIGTDINRRLSDVLGGCEDGVIELNEPSILFGQYRIIKLRKSPLVEAVTPAEKSLHR